MGLATSGEHHMIAIICGGREYRFTPQDVDLLEALPITMVFEGGATGADIEAQQWAIHAGIPHTTVRADWRPNGGPLDRSAGPKRNARMLRQALDEATSRGQLLIVVAFPGGRGTANMTRKARDAGVPVLMA
jgi:hypothetical protein